MDKLFKRLIAITFSMVTAYALGTVSQSSSPGTLQQGVSVFADSIKGHAAVGYDIQNESFEFGLNGNIGLTNPASTPRYTVYRFGIYGGFRRGIRPDLYGALGVLGDYGWYSDSGNAALDGKVNNSYAAGLFLGLEYQPKRYVQIFFRIAPYNYEKKPFGKRENDFFEEVQLGIKYFFSG